MNVATSGRTGRTEPITTQPGGGSNAAENNHHAVVRGENLTHIAAKHGVSLAALRKANPQIPNKNLIYPGQQINIPGATTDSVAAPTTTTRPIPS